MQSLYKLVNIGVITTETILINFIGMLFIPVHLNGFQKIVEMGFNLPSSVGPIAKFALVKQLS